MAKSSIQVASRLCGVGIHTLRAWEKRYGAVAPERADNGRRLYSEDEINKLKMLNDLCHFGNSIGAIANYSNHELSELLSKLSKNEHLNSPIPLAALGLEKVNFSNSLSHLLLAVDTYKLDVMSHELNKLVRILSPRDLVFNVLIPLLGEVSARVKQGSLTVVESTAISSIIKFHVGDSAYGTFRNASRSDKVFVFSAAANSSREFELLSRILLCSHYGHKSYHFGNNIPADILYQMTGALNADYLILDEGHTASDTDLSKILFKLGTKTKILVLSEQPKGVDTFRRRGQLMFLGSLNQFDELVKKL